MNGPPPPQPGQQPTPEQIAMMQRQLQMEAEKRGISVQEYVQQLKAQAMQQHQAQMRAQQAQQQGQAQPINPGPPKPEALAVANFLKSQELKPRTCILDEKRKDMFRAQQQSYNHGITTVKRAIRALESPAYQKARSKNPLLPEVTDRTTAENVFKLLPLSLLALRVSKVDLSHGHEGHNHAKPKRVKGLWTVRIEQHQEVDDDMHYVWLYEGSQWKQKLYAVGALILVIAVVLFPLWPLFMRQGVWYLSMGMLGLIGLFFAMAIFRLILFIITMFAVPPGLWLYPNLFEDVGFFDSFRPLWAWQETAEDKKAKKMAKKQKKAERAARKEAAANGKPATKSKKGASAPDPTAPAQTTPVTPAPQPTGSQPTTQSSSVGQRSRKATVEEADDE
ncbi:translocation protein [Lojkania enalia]|uniref:Translocation protein SEC62 n=1 Tax=Lojkania enalia TaxID=147567 RepID=A0A9P4KDQ2_9PLEO|nr:translocation protein [Didymosphaeria enalia]